MAKSSIRLANPLQEDSIVDGPGIRSVLWTQGCLHHCKNCHNPQTWDETQGSLYSIASIQQQLMDSQLQTGLTLSGGEPFLQSEALLPIVETARQKKLDIWAFTGFLFEDLLQDSLQKELLSKLDVLVDGKFVEELKDYRLTFKGSKNQRIIDVQASLAKDKIVLSSYDEKNDNL
ncbi:MAG: anaerobic ribonucleoside-triphosphate reductase activating protein [Lachnospiraceae bacterium]